MLFLTATISVIAIGKVLKIGEESVTVKFMSRKPNEKYDWPKKDCIEEVQSDQFICGPIKLCGGLPFTIKGVPQVMKDYITYD